MHPVRRIYLSPQIQPLLPKIQITVEMNKIAVSIQIRFLMKTIKTNKQVQINSPLSISPHPRNGYPVTQSDEDDSTDKSAGIIKKHKLLHGIVQWFRKLKRTLSSEDTSDRNVSDATKTKDVEIKKNQIGCYSDSHPQVLSSGSNGDSNQNLMKTLKNLGQTMLKHIQAIELVFQQGPGSVQAGLIGNLAKTSLIEKGQGTAITALKELRKISNLLSEM